MGLLDLRQQRGRDDRRIRTVQEGRDRSRYYRPEYGWVMSSAGVAEEEKVKKAYDDRAKKVSAAVEEEREKFQQAANTSRSKFRSAWSKNREKTVPVRVVDGNKILAQYTLPKSYVDQLHTENFGSGKKGTYFGSYMDDGIHYNVDVKVRGGGGKHPDEIKKALSNAHHQYRATVEAREREQAAQSSILNSSIRKERKRANTYWNGEIDKANKAYGVRLEKNAAAYEKKKNEYSQSVIGMNQGLLSSRLNGVAR